MHRVLCPCSCLQSTLACLFHQSIPDLHIQLHPVHSSSDLLLLYTQLSLVVPRCASFRHVSLRNHHRSRTPSFIPLTVPEMKQHAPVWLLLHFVRFNLKRAGVDSSHQRKPGMCAHVGIADLISGSTL